MKKNAILIAVVLGLAATYFLLTGTGPTHRAQKKSDKDKKTMNTKGLDTATLAAGCFWCTEAIYQNIKGVVSVVSGYAGGTVPHPSYEEVCTGTTGHAEACQILFDPKQISYAELLEAFWKMHDPTTLNRQGNDVGTQYRSAIFYHSEEQKTLAEHYKRQLDSAGAFDAPIVTQIVPYTTFYEAEDYHQNYYNEHGAQPYCQLVIRPKLDKFRKAFKDKLKQE